MIDISGENVVLVGALLLFVAVMAGKVAYRFGAPALLLFLGVGMLFGLNFISFRSVEMTQFVGMIALCIIGGSGYDGHGAGGLRLARRSVARSGDLLRAGAAAGRHDVLDRLGVGLLDPAKQEAGSQTASPSAAGAGERLERPDGLHAYDPADRRGHQLPGRGRSGHERPLFRGAAGRRHAFGLPDRAAGRVDDQQDQPGQPLALLGAAAGLHLLRLRLHGPRQGQRLPGGLPRGSGRGQP